MFFKTLQWRLVIIFVSLAIILVFIISLLLNQSIDKFYYDNFKKSIKKGFNNWEITENNTIAEVKSYLFDKKGTFLFDLDEYKSITIINDNNFNNIIYSTDEVYKTFQNNFINEISISDNLLKVMFNDDVNEGGLKKLLKVRYDGLESTYFDYATKINFSGEKYIFYFRMNTIIWEELSQNFKEIILRSILFSIILCLFIGFVMARYITRPIINLMHRARRLAAGDFDQIIDVKSEDEIGKLTGTFNNMAKSLKEKLIEISSEKNKIETIINYMTDGIIAFNLNGDIVHYNTAAKDILGEKSFKGNFKEYSEKYKINIDLQELIYLQTSTTKEMKIKVDEKDIRVYFAVFTDETKKPDGVIIVFQDITRQQKLDDMRRDFVANVSHELRTPLTTIKSYSETMISDELDNKEMAMKFLNVIDSEIDRMTRLVSDLLQLSRMDNRQIKWNFKDMSLDKLVKSCVDNISIRSKENKQNLECFIISSIPKIKADSDRIEQVIINILSNALKYTPEGGKISVYVGRLYNEVYAKIIDTGMGIPKEDEKRVFERFYRVDKARSRDMGGTGLGLSIAKEIIEAHNGKITITSNEGKGTEVRMSIPIKDNM